MNQAPPDEALLITLLCLVLVLIGSFLGHAIGSYEERKKFRSEAVQLNYAHWSVQPDGSTKFQWNKEVEK